MSGRFVEPALVRVTSRAQPSLLEAICGRIAERCVPILEIQVIRIGLIVVAMRGMDDVV